MLYDVNLNDVLTSSEKFEILDGDRIQIFSVLDNRQNVVQLSGAVTRPGSYDIGESLTLKQLLDKADGLLGDDIIERVDIVRLKSDFSEELLKINLEEIIQEDQI